jgi:hypothetical protein
MPKGNKKIRLNPERDLAILHFLWKWKVSTTKVIAARFFGNTNARNGYVRLAELAKAGLVECRVDLTGHKYVWLPGERGFEIISPNLPLLKEEGFRSEHIGHDLISSAVLLGEFLKDQPNDTTLISEQELRRVHDTRLPSQIPKGNSRRPDGYWCIERGKSSKLIALEVEIAQKSESEYKHIGYSYNQATSVDQVLWVVKSGSLALKIQNSFSRSELEKRNIHSFVLLSDFLKSGWQARVVSGHMLRLSIFDILGVIPPNSVVSTGVLSTVSAGVQSQCKAGVVRQFENFLSLARTHIDSNTYARYAVGDFS